jgi:hypothetical protein
MRRSLSSSLRKRGQIISGEFILATVIFMLVLGMILLMWTMTTVQINQSELVYSMDEAATGAVEKLVRTEGLPTNWSGLAADNISAVGLAGESRVLDYAKTVRFLSLMNDSSSSSTPAAYDNPCVTGTKYDCNRHLMGLGKYDFHLNLTYLNGSFIDETGIPPSSDSGYIISKKRNALLNGSVVTITLSVWS